MKKNVFLPLLLLILCLALISPGLVLADPNGRGPQPPVAELDVASTAIVFHPVTEFKRLSLTVTGPAEYVFERTVNKGELVFELSEETIDGCYTYELRVTPDFDPSILEILRESRETGDTSQVAQLRRDGKLPSEAHVQAGGFNVIEGRIVLTGDIEKDALGAFDGDIPPKARAEVFGTGAALQRADAASGIPTKDFVILDDLIVDGSACIGFDCVNGESFGFDTLRLKENNLRIKFDDTSTAASFPRNDWQLTANDSANGGASKFSIDDISGSRTPFTVEANARSHSLYVDDGGRIGSRTSTPSTEIHTIDGDTPTLRLQQDGSSGFAPQTWDVAGNETNFFIRDVSNGSQLPFRIRPDAPTSSIDIASDGDVGLGTASPSSPLHVLRTSAGAKDMLHLENNGPSRFLLENTNANSEWRFNADDGDDLRIAENITNLDTEFILTETGDLTITGTLTTGGPTCGAGCDRVFSVDYNLPTIEENASEMWSKSHLPAVGPTPEDGSPFNLTEKMGGMLNELEKAHIYIEQLNEQLKGQADVIEELRQRLASLEEGR